MNALVLAAENGSASISEALLNAGANPNAAVGAGQTPLMAAARTGSLETVRLLLAKGADVKARETGLGHTALMFELAIEIR